MSSRLVSSRLACGLICTIVACSQSGPRVQTEPTDERTKDAYVRPCRRPDVEKLRAIERRIVQGRTEFHFDKALFFKPLPIDVEALPHDLAPLIVQRFPSPTDAEYPGCNGDRSAIRFGSWSSMEFTEMGVPRFDPDRPGVYWHESSVEIHSATNDVTRSHRQFSYVWWYPSRDRDDPPAPEGFRMTLDEHGFPIVWEVLSARGGMEIVYVAESIEAAALDAFGPPLPGRMYAVEPAVADEPNLVVARVLADGPVPMGPFVYFGACPRVITTLLCRCMPSQADEFVETAYYELSPVTRLVELGFMPTDAFPFVRIDETESPASADDVDTEGTEGMAERSPLEGLRWPG